MLILGIETSCDETSVAVLETNPPSGKASEGQVKVLSNIVSSQIKIHAPFGGIVPSLAAREHERNLIPVLRKALLESNLISKFQFPISKQIPNSKSQILNSIDLIAVTQGPGLEIALWKGINFAEELAGFWSKPLFGINHLEGHIYSNWLPPIVKISNFHSDSRLRNGDPASHGSLSKPGTFDEKFLISKKFPILNLIVSGGHTQLVLMAGHGKFKLIGETLDDAAGEAFDKVARMMNLGYPGGPIVAARAAKFKTGEFKSLRVPGFKIKFPRPMLNSKNYNFSFSGLKTAVLYKLKELEKNKIKLTDNLINRICREFQQAVIDVLIAKTIKAAKEYKVKSVFLSGGVSANNLLRKTLKNETEKLKLFYSQPDLEYTGDNAAMTAMVGYFKSKFKSLKVSKFKNLKAEPNLKIKSW